jgi:hypothetical protein
VTVVRVYRLTVTWPGGVPLRPARRHYLTERGADHHAAVLREAGATVTVQPSRPIEWDDEPQETP